MLPAHEGVTNAVLANLLARRLHLLAYLAIFTKKVMCPIFTIVSLDLDNYFSACTYSRNRL